MRDRTLALTATAVGAVIAAIPPVQRILLLPVYLEQGDRLFAWLNRLSTMLLLPGKVLVYRVWPPPAHYFLTWQLLAAAAFNFLIYFFIALLLLTGYRRYRRKHNARRVVVDEDTAPSPDRRTFLVTAAAGTAGLGALAAGTYPVLIEPGWLKVRKLSISITGLPASLSGVTVAQLTDIHHDEWISAHHIRDAVNMANQLHPDIVALTGDYVTAHASLIKPAVAELKRLAPHIGTVAVMGNHDWWTDVEETRRQFAAAGIPLIDNSRRFITTDRQLGSDKITEGLCIGGVGDLWEDAVEPGKAFNNVPDDMPRLLLSHNPDVAEHGSVAAGLHRVDLMLCGHTHGGQVRLPGFGTPIVPSAYGSKYAYGLVKGPACPVNISSGIGLAMLPVRFNVRPEIVLITLRSA